MTTSQPRHIRLTAIFIGLILFGCIKTPVCPPPEVQPGALTIQPDSNYLGAEVDSAVAIWQTGEVVKQFLLVSNNGVWKTGLQEFPSGDGILTIILFTHMKFGGQYLSQWVTQRRIEIRPSDQIQITGPKNFLDVLWKPRVELKDQAGHSAVVAMRPDDSYFLIKQPPQGVKKMLVGREYWKTGSGMSRSGGGEWQCATNCTNLQGNIENSQFFSFLLAQIGDKPWNYVEVTVVYEMDQWGGGWVLSLNHTF